MLQSRDKLISSFDLWQAEVVDAQVRHVDDRRDQCSS